MFATIDQPARRNVAIVVIDRDGLQRRVIIPPNRFTYPEPLTAGALLRVATAPTRPQLTALGLAVLNAHLLPANRDPDALPTHLAHSRYRALLETPRGVVGDLDMVSPLRNSTSFADISDVRLQVLRLHFSMGAHELMYQPVGPTVVVHAGDARQARRD